MILTINHQYRGPYYLRVAGLGTGRRLPAVGERGSNQRTFLTVTVDISARRAAEDALRAANRNKALSS